jgi:phosphoglucosamine mutase
MARTLFGTDGIRGVAGSPPLDPATVFAFGTALGEWAASRATSSRPPRIVIGMDTRESGPWLAAHVAGGLARAGVESSFAGLTTTPGVAYLTRVEDFVAGVMISASHNPYRDNGLKAFDHSGFKLPDEIEHGIEARIFGLLSAGHPPAPLQLSPNPSLDRHYIDYLAAMEPAGLAGWKIVLDCANGAASFLAPALFARLGAGVVATACAPDGRNINLGCGALHVEPLRRRVLEEGADAGAAFDGDADRCILVSRSGKIIDGDHVMLIAAREFASLGRFRDGAAAVVATVMSNLGLERALERHAIRLLRTAVGDKYGLEEMVRRDLPLGGEQSGHVIFRDCATTGDGLLTALRVLGIARASGRTLDELTADFTSYPQLLVNVPVNTRRPLEELAAVQAAIHAAESEFGAAGRVLVRFSGTEPLARVMVEGPDQALVERHAHSIADAIRAALG